MTTTTCTVIVHSKSTFKGLILFQLVDSKSENSSDIATTEIVEFNGSFDNLKILSSGEDENESDVENNDSAEASKEGLLKKSVSVINDKYKYEKQI